MIRAKVFWQFGARMWGFFSAYHPFLRLCVCLSLSRLMKVLLSVPWLFHPSFPLALVFTLLPSPGSILLCTPSLALPSHSHALFCSVSGLWCFSYTRHITVTFSLCLSHPYTHVRFTLFPPLFLTSGAPSTSVSLSPPLSSFVFPLKSSEPESELMPLQSAFILTQREKERRGMYLDSAGAQLSLLLCEMIHLWLIALLGTLSKQTTSGCGIFHPNWLEL